MSRQNTPTRGPIGPRVALVACLTLLGAAVWLRNVSPPESQGPASLSELMARSLAKLDLDEAKARERHWKPELAAEAREARVIDLWNRLLQGGDQLETLRGHLAALEESQSISHFQLPAGWAGAAQWQGIDITKPAGPTRSLTSSAWASEIQAAALQGWRLGQVEARHVEFVPAGRPGTHDASRFYFSAHLTNATQPARLGITGEFLIRWKPTGAEVEVVPSSLTRTEAAGAPLLAPWLEVAIQPPSGSYFADPLLVCDLDRDGQLEVVAAAANLTWRWDAAAGQFVSKPFLPESPGWIFTGILGDFDGDQNIDFLCARFDGLHLYAGDGKGEFTLPSKPVWPASPRLKYAQALTAGDVDADGDLDLWLAQYKVPYEGGQMPTPVHNANDGDPSHFLLNDGQGQFTDATLASGLAPLRFRRTYSASWVDLNGDNALDLLVVSDFAGADLHLNDGRGRFQRSQSFFTPAPAGLGMGHLLTDFNQDGLVDLLMVGMNSPTASRLDQLGSRRGDASELAWRRALTFGNRLYLAEAGGAMRQHSPDPALERTGWSWGAAALDLDNDGAQEVYIANGHESKREALDYEREFWLSDIYLGASAENPLLHAWFSRKQQLTRGRGVSYGGHERNRLLHLTANLGWVDVAHAAGVAIPEDSRSVIAADLDGDGRQDLVVTTFELWPAQRQTVRIFRNQSHSTNGWIAVDLQAGLPAQASHGSTILFQWPTHSEARVVVSGDGYRSQQPPRAHLGLGARPTPTSIHVRSPGFGPRSIRPTHANSVLFLSSDSGL